MLSKDQCNTLLAGKYPHLYEIAYHYGDWFHPAAPVRRWLSDESLGYYLFLGALDELVKSLKDALPPRDFSRLAYNLMDPFNFWGNLVGMMAARWLMRRGLRIEEVERPYPDASGRSRRPDFTVSLDGEVGVIEVKSLAPGAREMAHVDWSDALVYLLHEVDLPFHVAFQGLPNTEAGLLTMVAELQDWLESEEASRPSGHKVLPCGQTITVDTSSKGWSATGTGVPNLHPTPSAQKRLFDHLSEKRQQVSGHSGFNCVIVDTSFFPDLTIGPTMQPIMQTWFASEDGDARVTSILAVQMDLRTATLATPFLWDNPQPRPWSSGPVHDALSARPTLTFERLVRGEF